MIECLADRNSKTKDISVTVTANVGVAVISRNISLYQECLVMLVRMDKVIADKVIADAKYNRVRIQE